ncbi:nucleotidyltransferase domain-containing protein [Xylanibacillus composti]|uniref:Polymerase nucleotidyl transferase domain-containing protein n=1 Tax=Xylanibacillus composti TaxID=1572762 RepID=A0A8J4M237_9BACL|nr:nucleotidyltransferase domain-containing protein [Xylanibacillus composti]MDT9726255.1 nucleotidyltransferase domain-containing protein [Xylanibacillus composti]GIQ68106.1 hypothetical protein XYCOK13_09300 [Xylanibacillus composti]
MDSNDPNVAEWVRHISYARYPHAAAIVLGGSHANGTANPRSDVDIAVIDNSVDAAYRESNIVEGKPVEWFVFTEKALPRFFREARRTALPTVLRLLACGRWLESSHGCRRWHSRAALFLAAGPAGWSLDEMNQARYELTELLEDLEENRDRIERLVVAQQLGVRLIRFYLRTEACWLGEGKWLWRMLELYNRGMASRYAAALDRLGREDDELPLIRLADEILDANGGRWFDGYYAEMRQLAD